MLTKNKPEPRPAEIRGGGAGPVPHRSTAAPPTVSGTKHQDRRSDFVFSFVPELSASLSIILEGTLSK